LVEQRRCADGPSTQVLQAAAPASGSSRKCRSLYLHLVSFNFRLGFVGFNFNGLFSIAISNRWFLQLKECGREVARFNCMISTACISLQILMSTVVMKLQVELHDEYCVCFSI